MRVLQVSSIYYPELKFGGPPEKIHRLGVGLRRYGYDVSVVTFHSEQPRLRERRMCDNISVQYVPWIGQGLRQFPVAPQLVTAAVASADIVHCYGLYNLLCPLASRAAARRGIPYIVEPQGMYVPRVRRLLLKHVYHWLYTRPMVRGAAAVVATSPQEWQELAPLVPAVKLQLRRNGIEIERFRALPAPDIFRRRFKLAHEVPIVLFIGRLSPIKNLAMLIEAFAALSDPAVLVLAGPAESDYEIELRRAMRQYGIGDRVIFTGPLYDEEKLAALAAAKLVVLPSLMESYGNAAAEAVAAGVPVLVTETCGIAPQIHRRAGLAVPVERSALADGLRRLLQDPVETAELTRRRSEVCAELGWDEPTRKMAAIYKLLAGRRD